MMTPEEVTMVLDAADWHDGDSTRRMAPETRSRVKLALAARDQHLAAGMAPRPRPKPDPVPDPRKKTPLQPLLAKSKKATKPKKKVT